MALKLATHSSGWDNALSSNVVVLFRKRQLTKVQMDNGFVKTFLAVGQRRLLLFLVFTSVMQAAILISLVMHWKNARNKLVRQVETNVCYDLSNIKDDARWQKVSNDLEETSFCQQASYVLTTLTHQVVDSRYDNAANPEVNPAPLQYIPHCRVSKKRLHSVQFGAIATFDVPEHGKPTKIYWSKDSLQGRDTRTFCNTSNVESEGFVEIQEPGFYLVSSKLTVSVENGTYDPSYILKGNYFRHYIMLISNRDQQEKILLENELSTCYMLSEKSEKTSQIEAVFKLEDGDRVYIATSHHHRIICAPQKDNFLIQKL